MRTAIKALFLLFFSATLALAQTSVTGTCSISLPSIALPVGMAFDGTTLTVPVVSATKLILTNGKAYPDGNYLTPMVGGVESLAPYTPAASSGGTPAGKTYAVTVPALAGWAQIWFLVPNATVVSGQVVSASPAFSGVPPASMLYLSGTVWVNATGQVYLRVGNGTDNPFPATPWTVTIK